MKLNAMSLKNILGYVVTPLMLISVGYTTNIFQDFLKQRLNSLWLVLIGFVMLGALLWGLTQLAIKKEQQQPVPSLQTDETNKAQMYRNNAIVLLLAVFLGTIISMTGNALLPFLKSQINQQGLTVILFMVAAMLIILGKELYNTDGVAYWLSSCFSFLVLTLWQPMAANWLFFALITVYSLKLFYLISRHLIRPYNKLVDQPFLAKSHLLLFLSPLKQTYLEASSDDPTKINLLAHIEKKQDKWKTMNTDMDEPINWEMAYRAIYSHLFPSSGKSRLMQVVIAISSTQENSFTKDKGSAHTIHHFVSCLQQLLQLWQVTTPIHLVLLIKQTEDATKTIRFDCVPYQPGKDYSSNGINSGSFEETIAALSHAVTTYKQQNVNEHDIIIDITGWQKTTSAAGVLVATVTDINNQYIGTNDKKAYIYDFTFNDFTKLT